MMKDGPIYIPRLMTEGKNDTVREVIDYGGLPKWCKDKGHEYEVFAKQFQAARLKYDLEFFGATVAEIEYDTATRDKTGLNVGPLVCNRAQLLFLKILWEAIENGEPIRVVLLKARQWGGSTLTQVLISWVQRLVKSNWHAFVCTLTKGQAQHLRKMHKRIAASMTRHGIPTSMGSYEGSQHNLIMDETSSIIGVSSIENPDAIRGFALNMVHLSEVGLFPSTVHVNAESYVQAIIPTLSDAAWTMIIMESTAKGVGNFFHQQWQDAQKESSPYTPVFIPWHVVPKYARDVTDPAAFIGAMDEYDQFLWKEGATLEHINWYHYQLGIYKGDLKVMQNEYPTVPAEAFQSSGNRYFPLALVQKRRKNIMDPAFEGDLVAGKLIEKPEGGLRIWHHPGEVVEGMVKGQKYLDRYVGFADFGGTTEKADWSVLTVVDRAPTLTGGPARLAARLRVHLRPDLYAWECIEILRMYDNCMFVPEINRHSSERGDAIRGYEPEWSLTVIEEISEEYGNVYYRTSHGRGDKKQTLEIGFHTNQSTKPMMINGLLVSLEENTYIDYDWMLYDELDVFEKKQDGKLEAVDGQHDDIVISAAGAVHIAYKYLPPMGKAPDASIRPRRGGFAQF